MPKCLNDPKSSYKGDEPSPKGLGYCAHAEKINKTRKGRDGFMWIVKPNTSGVKRWVKDTAQTSEPTNTKLVTRNISKLADAELMNNLKLLLKEKKIDKKLYRVYNETVETLIKHKGSTQIMPMIINKISSTKKLGMHKIKIMSTDKMIITDPSYEYGEMSNELKVKPGVWNVYYQSWIFDRPNQLVIVHQNYMDNNDIKFTGKPLRIGVDAGHVLVTDLDSYPSFDSTDEDNGYEQLDWAEKHAYTTNKFYRKLPNGYCVRSGWGDGIYEGLVGKVSNVIVKIVVLFIN